MTPHRVPEQEVATREQHYAAIEKECLAMVWALKKLEPYLFGRHFTVYTDHSPLTWLHQMKGANAKLLSHLSFFASKASPTAMILNLWEARHFPSGNLAQLAAAVAEVGKQDSALFAVSEAEC
ncbi:unnamed protein product [Natator depressus]